MRFPYKFIDLTHTLDSYIPTWEGDCGFNHELYIDYSDCEDQAQFRVMKIKMHAGIGTHIDAPSHSTPAGKSINDLEIDKLCMPCIVIDVTDKSNQRYSLMPEDINLFESKYGCIPKNSCVMVKTGWSKFWDTPLKYHNNYIFPSVSYEAAKILLERDISALGIDTLSPDRPEDGFKVHKIFLGSGKMLIENVANLDNMPPIDAFVIAMPIKIKNGTEAPVRLIGLIEKE